jgi:hypothetical protein
VGYLSRNKPKLMREIEGIEEELSEIYQSIKNFIGDLLKEVPQFGEISFAKDHESSHQLT